MSNNKQNSIDWYAKQIDILYYDYITGNLSNKEKNERFKQLKEQAKAMHKEEKIKFATDFFFWWYNQTSGTNTVEAVEKYYNKTYADGKQ